MSHNFTGCDYSIASPTNGNVDVSGYLVGLSSSVRYAVGANATYACDPGYTLVGGTNPRQCLANGTWSGSRPDCDPVSKYGMYSPRSGLEVINLEFILRLKIKRNDWLLADTCPQAANHSALF